MFFDVTCCLLLASLAFLSFHLFRCCRCQLWRCCWGCIVPVLEASTDRNFALLTQSCRSLSWDGLADFLPDDVPDRSFAWGEGVSSIHLCVFPRFHHWYWLHIDRADTSVAWGGFRCSGLWLLFERTLPGFSDPWVQLWYSCFRCLPLLLLVSLEDSFELINQWAAKTGALQFPALPV